MAWDKVTKIDAIAKRKPYTRSHLGKLLEYAGTRHIVPEEFVRPRLILTNKQKRAKSKDFNVTMHIRAGGNRSSTSWPTQPRVQYGSGDARK